MKEELQTKLVEVLNAMQSAAGQAKDFTLTQLPEIAQSYVIYGRAMSIANLLIVILASVGFALLFRKLLAMHEEDDSSPFVFIGGMVSAMAVVGMGIFAIAAVNSAALVWFAPKVWLLKEIAGLIK